MLAAFQAQAVDRMKMDPRICGVLAAGSVASGRVDRFSDLDLVIVVEDDAYPQVMSAKEVFATELGDLMVSFSGEHVGEPRLLICLYAVPEGDEVLHVDLKFIKADDLAVRVDDPAVLWERDGRCATALAAHASMWPEQSSQWFEDRFWLWLHYAAARLARGEVFEAINMINWIRYQVLGPMLARRAGAPQRGLRHIETIAEAHDAMAPTATSTDTRSLWEATVSVRDLYVTLRKGHEPEALRTEAEARVSRYVDHLRKIAA